MNDKPTENVVNNLPIITKFIYSIGVLPTSYKMSMTYEEQVVWLCNYLETTIIPAVNQNGEAVEELQNLYELLRTYVNDYFDNLDVQDEINNKLESMVQNGELTLLIKDYVDPIYQQYQEDINNNLENYKQVINSDLLSMNDKINTAVGNNPVVVNSTSDMVDTSKIYINKTDSKWYYYNGSEWTIGGNYLQTTFDDNTIKNNMIESVDYSKVIKDSIKNDFSDITAWRNATCLGGYRSISIDSTEASNYPAGARTPTIYLDKTKDTYLYFNATGVDGTVILYDDNTYKHEVCKSYSNETDRRTYVKIPKSKYQDITSPALRFLADESGTLTYSDIIIAQYDFINYSDNLLSQVENKDYSNFSQNKVQTKLDEWTRSYGNASLVPLIRHSINTFDIIYNEETTNYRAWKSPFSDNFNGNLNIKFNLNIPSGLNVNVYMINSDNEFVIIEENLTTGEHNYNIDLSYYAIYHEFEDWSFMISANKDNASDVLILNVTDFEFYVSKISNLEIYDTNFENMIQKIGNKLTNINAESEVKTYISNGNEKCVIRSNTNGLVSIPVVPNKTLIIGNSLLLGNEHGEYAFGMAASNIESDYFYHFREYITSIKNNATFTKFKGVDFENCVNDTNYNNFISSLDPYLANDLDLVIIQLGDNVNTNEKREYFNTSCKKLVQYISTNCPNARIVWVGMWYSNQIKMNIINKMVFETGTEFINIQDIRNTNTESAIGNVITYPDGYSTTITNSGVASHPGDLGMEKIANRILFKLGIKSSE